MEATLADTDITIKYLVDKLQAEREEKVELSDASVAVIGEEGFASNIFKVSLNWQKPCDLPSNVLVKIPTASKFVAANDKIGLEGEAAEFYKKTLGQEENFKTLATMGHNTEVRIYKYWERDPAISAPKIYFSRNADSKNGIEGILMMEDLSEKATVARLADGLSLNQVLAVVDQLTSLHAFSLTLAKGWEKEFAKNGCAKLKLMETFAKHTGNVSMCLKNTDPDRFGDLITKLEPHSRVMSIFKSFTSSLWLNMPQVLVHGDLWTCNLLWAKDQNGHATDDLVAIIDWQSCHPGNVAEDLARLLATSVSADIRCRHMETILSHYYKGLCHKFGREPFSLAQVRRAYKAILPSINVFMAAGVPIYVTSTAITGEGPDKEVSNERILERAEVSLRDFLYNEEKLTLTVKENIKWSAIKVFLWICFKVA